MFHYAEKCERCGKRGAWAFVAFGAFPFLACADCHLEIDSDPQISDLDSSHSLAVAKLEWAKRRGYQADVGEAVAVKNDLRLECLEVIKALRAGWKAVKKSEES